MLGSSEIKLLSNLTDTRDQELTLHEVSERLSWSDNYTSRVVSSLRDRDYLQTNRVGRERLVSINDIQPVEQLLDFVNEYSHIDFPELLSGAALEILYYLDTSRTASELAELSQKNRKTVYRRMEALQNTGIVRKDHSRFQLTPEFISLSGLARSIGHHEHRQEALAETEEVTIIWETLDEYLFSCGREVTAEGFHRTGPTVFEKFGIPLLTRDRLHYLRTQSGYELTAPDLICHTLLIDDGTRYRTYCLLLIESQEIDQSLLKERAEHYQIEAKIDLLSIVKSLNSYLKTKGDVTDETLPDWKDFKSTASDYDIVV